MNPLSRTFSPIATVAFLFLLLFVSLPEQSSAAEDPIPLIDVVVERVPPGNGKVTYQTKTDARGYIRFRSLPEGRYVVTDPAKNTRVFQHSGGPVQWLFTGKKKR